MKPCKRNTKRIIATASLILFVMSTARAAYYIARPVGSADEPISQGRLYGMDIDVHRGLDWHTPTLGDPVYAVASGTVRQVVEEIVNDCHPSTCPNTTDWGNFVLIEHDQRHYDAQAGSNGYVYSLYLHLQQNSVPINANQHVNRGQLIAGVGNTGNSTGNHAHLQIIIHPQSGQQLWPNNTVGSEQNSRNPELWLYPFPPNQSTAIGLVTDNNGNPVGNLQIVGLSKSAAGYTHNLTYNNTDLNGDDIFHENFGTTDITPGTYSLEARNPNGSLYKDLGSYTFRDNSERTFVGLYPVYLPDIRQTTQWNTQVHVRNNSSVATARVITTFFQDDGSVRSQRTDLVVPNGKLSLTPPTGFLGSAIVVSSQDIVTSVLMEHPSPFSGAAYDGVQERYDHLVPLVHRNNGGWNSEIAVHNAGGFTDFVSVTFRTLTGGVQCTLHNTNLAANATWRINTASLQNCLGTTFVGYAWVLSPNRPIAVSNLQYTSNYSSVIGSSSNFVGSGIRFAPLMQNNNGGWTSGTAFVNYTNSSRMFTATFYELTGAICYTTPSAIATVGPLNLKLANPAPPVGTNCTGTPVLAARVVTSGSNPATYGQVNQIILNQKPAAGYPAIANPTTTAYVAHLEKNATWSSGLQIQNSSPSSASVTVSYYNSNGTLNTSQVFTIAGSGTYNVYPISPPSGFNGSAIVASTNGKNIAVVVNRLKLGGSTTTDTLMSYVGLNR